MWSMFTSFLWYFLCLFSCLPCISILLLAALFSQCLSSWWLRTCCCTHVEVMAHLTFMEIWSTILRSFQNVQDCLMSCFTSSMLDDKPLIMYSFTLNECLLFCVASCMSCIDIHIDIYVLVLMASMFYFIPHMSLSLFSSWFCLDSQPTTYKLGPTLYFMQILYWWILSCLHWSHCNTIAVFFLSIMTNSLWSVMVLTFLAKE